MPLCPSNLQYKLLENGKYIKMDILSQTLYIYKIQHDFNKEFIERYQ